MIVLTHLTAAQYKGIEAVDLTFPERGSILIEGRNEAGKSTLFDAIHFALYGVPLVGDLADAIHYGGEEMGVHLGLAAGGTKLSVRRSVRRTAKAVQAGAELEVTRGDDVEVVKGRRAVTQRLQLELGGLTSEALLNSCLVAQKQLGRLETLTRQSREEALTVLLNLGKLTDVHQLLRVKVDDEEQVRRARARVELARATEALATIAARRERLDRTRRLIELRETLDRLRLNQDETAAAQLAIAGHTERLAALRAQLAEVDAIKTALERWRRVVDQIERDRTLADDISHLRRRASEAAAAGEALPALKERLAAIQAARASVQGLLDAWARARSLENEAERAAARLRERRETAVRFERLTGALDALRKERRDLLAQLTLLAPALAELDASRARHAGLQQLLRETARLIDGRITLESIAEQRAARDVADREVDEARAALARARAQLARAERLREAWQARQLAEQRTVALTRWIEARRAHERAAHVRRLLDDLALGVTGVEHVALPRPAGDAAGGVTDGLRLRLLVDHPLTGALSLHLALWSGGAELIEAKAVSSKEAERLTSSSLPSLSAADAEAQADDLLDATDALKATDEPEPRDVTAAERRVRELARVIGQVAPAFDEAAYQQLAAAVGVDEMAVRRAEAQAAALPDPAQLAETYKQAQQTLASLGTRCRDAAVRLGVTPATIDDVEAFRAAVEHEIERESARQAELLGTVGRRDGLTGQIDLLERNGKERKRELEECAHALEAVSEAALIEDGKRIGAALDVASADARRLEEAVAAFLRARSEGARPSGEEDAVALRGVLEREIDDLAGQVAVLEARAAEHDTLLAEIGRLEQARAAVREQIDRALADAGEHDPAAGRTDGDVDPVLSAATASESVGRLAADLAARDEPALRAGEMDAQRALGGAEDHLRRLCDDARALARACGALAQSLGVSLPDTTDFFEVAPAVERLVPEAAGALPSRAAVEQQLSALDQERGSHERGVHDARLTLGDEAPLPLAEAQAALAALDRRLAARRRGQEIVAATRQRMIGKVLPGTVTNMCLLLPALTAERYHHAELTPEYRLQVWDTRKRGFVEKSLFSGGTQDQFSLALRLGFALAALPRELGTSPGFLFLDEPLSSFDRDRTEALVNLLTRGQVATFFQQVFLISHSQAFDAGLFTHHVVMEGGRVAESSLPVATAGLS